MEHTEKEVTIIVNARPKEWTEKQITYEQVVVLAFGSYTDDEKIDYTVSFSKGEDSKKEGTLTKGEHVKVKNGMVFNVTRTDRS